MRRIYLIRHGQPLLPGGEPHCLGTCLLYTSPIGRLQGCLLAAALGDRPLTVFSSPLSRALETARFLDAGPIVLPGLREYATGDWDGLPFSEIRDRWPEIYEARGRDRSVPIPNSEPFEAGQQRFADALQEALRQSDGDIALVTHAGVIQAFLSLLLGSRRCEEPSWRPPCGGWYLLEADGGELKPCLPWETPKPALTEELCLAMHRAAALPPHITAHCRAVAAEAERIAAALACAGHALDSALIRRAALLHDLARLEPQHAETGAQWLAALGYPEEAAIVRRHHDLDGEAIDEAAVVFLADKCVRGTQLVPIRERFAASRGKCRDSEALAAHERRLQQALALAAAVNTECSQEVIR